jgi:membrane associated rhomboid family serine protease
MGRRSKGLAAADFGPQMAGTTIFVFLCLLFFFGLGEAETSRLRLSVSQPWGILTSTYIHMGSDHLFNNMLGLVATSVITFATNLPAPRPVRRKICAAFVYLLFLTGPIVGSVEYLIFFFYKRFDLSSCGASDVVYAVIALFIVSSVLSIPLSWKRSARLLFLMNVSLAFILIFPLLYAPEVFFSVAPGVDIAAHVGGFLIGLFLSIYLLLPAYSRYL